MLALTLLIVSCKRSFLDVPPQGKLTEELALTDPDAAEKLVISVYNALYLQGTFGLKFLILGDVTSDNSDKGSVESDPGFDGVFLDNFNYNPNTGIFNDVWNDNYRGITRANKAIDILNASTIDESTKKRLTGESRFLRGLFYFNLVREFGGVIKLTTVPNAT